MKILPCMLPAGRKNSVPSIYKFQSFKGNYFNQFIAGKQGLFDDTALDYYAHADLNLIKNNIQQMQDASQDKPQVVAGLEIQKQSMIMGYMLGIQRAKRLLSSLNNQITNIRDWIESKAYRNAELSIRVLKEFLDVADNGLTKEFTQEIDNSERFLEDDTGKFRGLAASSERVDIQTYGLKQTNTAQKTQAVTGQEKGFARIKGMKAIKEQLWDEVIDPMLHPEEYQEYGIMPLNGILLYGPKGCGKTLTMEAICEELGRKCYKLSPDSVASHFMGDGIREIKKVFDEARENAPSVVYIDEIDALTPSRSDLDNSTSGAVETNREVNQLLLELNNCRDKDIFIIASTNLPNKIDSAIRRAGRIDREFEIPYPDLDTRIELFNMYLSRIKRIDESINDDSILSFAQACEGKIAGDIELLIRNAALKAKKENTDLSVRHIEAVIGKNDGIKVKKPSVAGKCYPKDKEALEKQLQTFRENDTNTNTYRTRAVIVPHMIFDISGQTAYSAINQMDKNIKNLFIIAPAHKEGFKGLALSSYDKWNTPLGNISLNQDISKELKDKFGAQDMDEAYIKEHSVEVEVPIIQSVFKDVSIIPILIGDENPQKIKDIISEYYNNPEYGFIISSDLSHYLSNSEAKKADAKTAQMIEAGETEELNDDMACNSIGIKGISDFAKQSGFSLKRIDIKNSSDIIGDKSRVVGFGSWFLEE